MIARDPSRLDDAVRNQVEVIAGSHGDRAVLSEALDGAQGLFWLVPPNVRVASTREYYLSLTRTAVEAIRRHEVSHVVGVSSAGRHWPHPAGLLSAAFAMDDELERTGAAYRSLGMPFYMENLLGQLSRITSEGVFSLPMRPDRPLPTIATRDIATTAAGLLTDRSWEGAEQIPVFGPDRLTPDEMAAIITQALGSPVAFEQAELEQLTAATIERGVPEPVARDFAAMYEAQQNGIYDEDWAHASPTPTSFQTWCETVLAHAAR